MALSKEVQWEMTGVALTASIHTPPLLGSRVMAGDRRYSLKAVGQCTGMIKNKSKESVEGQKGKICYAAVSICGLWTCVCAAFLWQQHGAGKAGEEGDEWRDSFLGGRRQDRLCVSEKREVRGI